MNWNEGYQATYYACFVDAKTWRSLNRLEIVSGEVTRTNEGLRESASLDVGDLDIEGENWIRIYLDARQGDTSEHIALFTGLATSPGTNWWGYVPQHNLDAYSVLKPLEDVLLQRGWYAAAGSNGARVINSLLAPTPAPVAIDDNAPSLTESIIAEEGETHLTMIEKVLTAINWRIRIAGDGTINITPASEESITQFDPIDDDSIELDLTIENDWFSAPNVYRAVSGDLVGIARDDSPDSILSTVNRGREIWQESGTADINTGETIAEYANRMLKEAQAISQKAKYNRRFRPDVMPTDVITLHYPGIGLEGKYRIDNQRIALEYNAQTAEEVIKL